MAETESFTANYKSMQTPYKEFRMEGVYPCRLKNARGICIEPETGRIYVVERGHSRIQVFSSEGDHEFMFYPNRIRTDLWGICIRDGLVVVSGYFGGRLFAFTLDGEFVSEFGKGFTRNGELIPLSQPMGLTIGQDGEIHICEFGTSNLVILTHQPALVNDFHITTTEKPHDVVLLKDKMSSLLALTSGCIEIEDKMYPLNNSISLSWFGHVDPNGILILSDVTSCSILIFDLKSGAPELVHKIGMTTFGSPMGVAVDKKGRIVCVTTNKMYFFR